MGFQAIQQTFQSRQGKYFLLELKANVGAVAFWKKTLTKLQVDFEEKEMVLDGVACLVQKFKISGEGNEN